MNAVPGVHAVLDAIPTAARQAATVRETAHRPWPLPQEPWLLGQTWQSLLFAHWPVDEALLLPHVPAPLELDTHDGRAWLGMTPSRLEGVRLRGTPPVPVLSSFLELAVRTYVTLAGKPGIWFLSLDASSRLAVEASRRTFSLPSFRARMVLRRHGERVSFASERAGDGRTFSARYAPAAAEAAPAAPGTLEHFFAERYCLYAVRDERPLRAEIHHPPWRLRAATGEVRGQRMAPEGVELPLEPPLLHVAERQDAVVWSPREA